MVAAVRRNLRAFVGVTAFEDLCLQWVLAQAKTGQLPFSPDSIGSHWSSKVQVDVTAINWKTHDILLGEYKWGADQVDRQVARELIENKAPLVLKDLPKKSEAWHVDYVLSARSGFTPAAAAEMQKVQGSLVDLKESNLC